MAFLRVVEVFPPMFKREEKGGDLQGKLEELVAEVDKIRHLADLVLVANHKDIRFIKASPVHTAAALKDRIGVDAAPVLVARDVNRAKMVSDIATAFSLGIRTLMLAWGDRYPAGGPRNVYDYSGLSAVIAEARELAGKMGVDSRLLAPVDLRSLGSKEDLSGERLSAGASLLLAQPATADLETYRDHIGALDRAGLRDKVLPYVFPLRSREDIDRCERFFGWKFSDSTRRAAERGKEALLEQARDVAAHLRKDGLAGVYLATRGDPSVAGKVL